MESRGLKPAAVLVPFFLKNATLHVLLTKRTDSVEHHKGQISFPGGAVDREDRDTVDAALREAEEEIGLQRSQVDILGAFDDFWTPSGYSITPVVAMLRSVDGLRPNDHEVAAIFDAPVEFFLDKKNERVKKVERDGTVHDVYYYNYGEYEIWGATAAMLRSFLTALTDEVKRS
jgi:8-oxo-dGTP pyrophosphatase MutT (NUDIX family)